MMLHSMQFKGNCLTIMTGRLQSHELEERDVDEGMLYGALDLSNGEVSSLSW